MVWEKLVVCNEKTNLNVENAGHLASRDGSARVAEQNASNTGCAALYRLVATLICAKPNKWEILLHVFPLFRNCHSTSCFLATLACIC